MSSAGLARHIQIRRHYDKNRYMRRLTQDELNVRIRDVFLNMLRLTPDGKIGVPPIDAAFALWNEKWTHVLEEMQLRHGPYPGGFTRDILHREPFPDLVSELARKAARILTAYVVAGLSHRTGGRIDFDKLWSKQTISPALEQLIGDWAPKLDEVMRKSAGQKNPSEWFKKADCWKDIQAQLPTLTDPLPPELSFEKADGKVDGVTMIPATGTHSVVDYERIARCMQIPSSVWMEVAERGQKTETIHWKVAGICRTLAGYAAGGWERKPSAKQAKPALEAVLAVERAGLVNTVMNAQTVEGNQP